MSTKMPLIADNLEIKGIIYNNEKKRDGRAKVNI